MLITLEDLLEELVGTIDDEHDVPTPLDSVVPLGGSRYEVDASLDMESLNDRLHLRLPTDGDFLTLQLYTLGELDRVLDTVKQARYGHVETIGSDLGDAGNAAFKVEGDRARKSRRRWSSIPGPAAPR